MLEYCDSGSKLYRVDVVDYDKTSVKRCCGKMQILKL